MDLINNAVRYEWFVMSNVQGQTWKKTPKSQCPIPLHCTQIPASHTLQHPCTPSSQPHCWCTWALLDPPPQRWFSALRSLSPFTPSFPVCFKFFPCFQDLYWADIFWEFGHFWSKLILISRSLQGHINLSHPAWWNYSLDRTNSAWEPWLANTNSVVQSMTGLSLFWKV